MLSVAIKSKMLSVAMLSVIMMNIYMLCSDGITIIMVLSVMYAECCNKVYNAECRYAECHHDE
jgi:hypothetical protein